MEVQIETFMFESADINEESNGRNLEGGKKSEERNLFEGICSECSDGEESGGRNLQRGIFLEDYVQKNLMGGIWREESADNNHQRGICREESAERNLQRGICRKESLRRFY